jgi:hypothetical protein
MRLGFNVAKESGKDSAIAYQVNKIFVSVFVVELLPI